MFFLIACFPDGRTFGKLPVCFTPAVNMRSPPRNRRRVVRSLAFTFASMFVACSDPSSPAGSKLVDLSARGKVCVLDDRGIVHCRQPHNYWPYDTLWVDTPGGELGDDTTFPTRTPSRVYGGHPFRVVSPGFAHTCALTTTGEAWCWGENKRGELGDSTAEFFRKAPVQVAGGLTFVGIAAGTGHTCALVADGTVYCWGGFSDQKPEPVRRLYRSVPQRIASGSRFVRLGADGSCGLTAMGEIHCWTFAFNSDGTAYPLPPVRRSGDLRFASLGVNGNTAVTTDGTVYVLEHLEWQGVVPLAMMPGAEALRFSVFDGPCGLDQSGNIHCRTLSGLEEIVRPR